MSLHDEIMNIQADKAADEKIYGQMAYKRGHRDARHAAAELAILHDQGMERMKSDLDRLHRERDAFQQQCSAMAEENERVRLVLDDAYALAIGHAAAYKFNHNLDVIHPKHVDILKKCREILEPAKQQKLVKTKTTIDHHPV